METAGRPLGRDRTAIAASIALHLCAVIALATLPRASFPVDDPDERLLLASQIRVEHRPPARAVLVRRALAPRADTARPAVRPVIHTAVTVEHAARRLVVAPEAPNAYAPSASASAIPEAPREADPGVAPSRLAAAATTQAVEASPTPPAPPSPAPTAAAQVDEGVGNFGETYPASIEPTLRSALAAVGSGFVVRITVDENGHATSVEFMRAPPDSTLREALRVKLLAARFIPAACNGLRCAGTVELRT
jgi:hypothetical protein